MTYAFTFDARSCTGCKACQVACQDHNGLSAGVLWRRVYEVSGGDWQRQGAAWSSTVFAWNLSLACNHCVHPKCAGVCPADAYQVRPDGIVRIDPARCLGCGYCAWACPYDAPRMDRAAGVMTKCHLCADDLDAGLPPSCVAACPMRCLGLVRVEDLPAGSEDRLQLWDLPAVEHPFPLPAFSRTEPHLAILPHPASGREGARVANREEVTTREERSPRQELPLVFFTLLAQAAIGISWVTFLSIFFPGGSGGLPVLAPTLAAGALVALSLLVSFLHLGRPLHAWRALGHLRKSWLSREILFLGLFAALLGLQVLLSLVGLAGDLAGRVLVTLTALCGLAALESMQSVYRLRSVPAWNTGRTRLEFHATALGLGSFLGGLLLPRALLPASTPWLLALAFAAFLAGGGLLLTGSREYPRLRLIRGGLVLAVLSGLILLAIFPASFLNLVVLLLAFAAEALGRWLFYARRKPNL